MNHYKAWLNKLQHGCLEKTRKNVNKVNKQRTNNWLLNAPFSSHVQGCMLAVQEEEINTNNLKSKRDKKHNKILNVAFVMQRKKRFNTSLQLAPN